MIDSLDQWDEVQRNYYRLELSTRGQRLVEGLEYLANRKNFSDQHTRDIHLYLFIRAAQREPELVARYRALLKGGSSEGRLFISTILSLLGQEDVAPPAEQVGPTFPTGLDALSRPVRAGSDLDYLWVDFFLTGGEEPVRTIIKVIAWPDRIRSRLETWLGTPASGLHERWRRRQTAKRLEERFGIVCNLETGRVDTPGDLDARCAVDANEQLRPGYLRDNLPIPISEDDALYVATKGVARWSLASMVRRDLTVEAVYEKSLRGLREGVALRCSHSTHRRPGWAAEAHNISRSERPSVDGPSAFDRGDYQEALNEYLPRAEQGDAPAQHMVALVHATGLGGGPDFAKAFEWWRKAADQGFTEAKYAIGNLYSQGLGTTRDYGKAADWFKRAAEKGHPSAQYNLGNLYFQGLGVPADLDQARLLFRLAAIGYQERIDQGFGGMRKPKRDAVRLRRLSRLFGALRRPQVLLRTLGIGTRRALHDAANRGDVEQITRLIRTGVDVNALDANDVTPLARAAIYGHQETAELLMANGADPNARGKDGATPLYAAVQEGRITMAEWLLTHGADVNVRVAGGATAFIKAAARNDTSMMDSLVAAGADIHAAGDTGFTALHLAAQEGHAEAVTWLVSNGANVHNANDNGDTPLHQVALNGHTEVGRILLTSGAHVGAKAVGGATPLHRAAVNGHEGMIELLLSHGADPNSRGEEGITPLYLASLQGHRAAVEVLVTHRADMNARRSDGSSPLLVATHNRHVGIAELLRRYGARE
jgi:ankyrin repeat protein